MMMQTQAALHITVNDGANTVGVLARSAEQDGIYLFDYRKDLLAKSLIEQRQHAVSLTMPVTNVQYDAMTTLHPIFEMNLPEGALRVKLQQRFAKAIPNFDALDLLGIVGQSQLGRLLYLPSSNATSVAVPEQNIRQLLTYQGSEDLFADLMDRYALHSGVSGMQPKVLLRAGGKMSDLKLDRITDKGATHIVKSFDSREYFDLCAVEFFCMQAAKLSGLNTANVTLSDNRKILLVERFDLADGHYSGFEDFCVLSGKRADGRYDSSYERLAQLVTIYVDPAHRAHDLHQLFKTVVLACVIGNGDAHLKNFAVLYDDIGVNVRLSPIYDMVSTLPYMPRDSMALTLGDSKAFPDAKQLMAFGKHHCFLTQVAVRRVMEEVQTGVKASIIRMRRYAAKNPSFAKTAEKLVEIFRAGMEKSLA